MHVPYEYHTVPTDQFILTIHSTKGECLYQSGSRSLYIALQIPVLGIRIRRIRMFLRLLDPDLLVIGMDPDPDPDPSLFL
jgi:hypothetical protein